MPEHFYGDYTKSVERNRELQTNPLAKHLQSGVSFIGEPRLEYGTSSIRTLKTEFSTFCTQRSIHFQNLLISDPH